MVFIDISVVLPVRNEQDTILRVLDSLQAQTAIPFKIVIVDGGSIDRTKELISSRSGEGNSIILLEHPNAFPGHARNIGINAVMSEWIALTDAGTFIPPGWLSSFEQISSADDRADVILGSYEPILNNFFQECLALAFVAPAENIKGRYIRGPSTASMMMKKSVWEVLGGFPEHLRAAEDLVFFDKLAASDFKIAYAPNAVIYWQIPGDFAGVFYKFRTYSKNMLKAGLGGRWHKSIAGMYVVGLLLTGLSIFHHWAWGILILAAYALRVHRSIQRRGPFLHLAHRIGLHSYLMVGMILLWIDFACFVGSLDYLQSGSDASGSD